MAKLGTGFYTNPDVIEVARMMIGKVLFTKINNQLTGGIITETEAYNGIIDRASHAFGDRRTNRTEIMYRKGGTAYIYLCYGIHSLFNVVTNQEGIPHAVLVRAVYPFTGKKLMLSRRGASKISRPTAIGSLFRGPGKVSMALALHHSLTGTSLLGNTIWLEDLNFNFSNSDIEITPRIGVEYAGVDAALPYRFNLKNMPAEFFLT